MQTSIRERMMRMALAQAQKALSLGEVPVGAVVARGEEVLSAAHNLRETTHDPTAHAEVLALRAAADKLGDWRLEGCQLYVTLEPCAMCAGAIVQSRIERVYFGAYDEKMGCAGSVYRITEDPAFSHFTPAEGGLLAEPCRQLLEDFLKKARRAGEKSVSAT